MFHITPARFNQITTRPITEKFGVTTRGVSPARVSFIRKRIVSINKDASRLLREVKFTKAAYKDSYILAALKCELTINDLAGHEHGLLRRSGRHRVLPIKRA